jgi:cytochrome b6-f complex iron-sulfur subunit
MSDRLTPEPKTRRDILSWAAIGTASVTVLGTCCTMARLVKPRLLPEAASRFSIGHPDEFVGGTEKIITQRNVVIVATSDGVAAISLVCTHLGCIVARTAQGFSCPCHGSDFDDQGKIMGGPAPKDLPWLEVSRRADGKLQVDLKQEVALGTFYSV